MSNPVLPKKDHGRCRSCHTRILWTRTAKGAAMPLDVEPCADGKFFALEQPDRLLPLQAVPVDELSARAGEARRTGQPRFMAHWARCPDADKWKRGQ